MSQGNQHTRRAATLSMMFAAFAAFVVAGLVAAGTIRLTAQVAGLCEGGHAEKIVDESFLPNGKDGVTVHCVRQGRREDVGTAALFIGWGVYSVLLFFPIWALLFLVTRRVLSTS